MADDPKQFKAGDVLKASDLNAIVDALGPLGLVRGGPGLSVRRSVGGLQITSTASRRRGIGVASGNIAARSGSTYGTGTLNIYWDNGSALAATGDTIAVKYASSKAQTSGNGINSGQYCSFEEDEYGTVWVAPLECS